MKYLLLNRGLVRRILSFNSCNLSQGVAAIQPLCSLCIYRSYKTSISLRTKPKHLPSSNSVAIYEGPVTKLVKGIKIFSFSTSFLGFVIQPVLVSKTIATGSLLPVIVSGIIGLYAILTPIFLHLIVKRYVVRLYFDSTNESFTSVTLDFFCRERNTTFTPTDVLIPEVPGPLTTFKVKGKPLLLDPEHFTNAMYYGRLMGYDKPLDLRLGNVDNIKK